MPPPVDLALVPLDGERPKIKPKSPTKNVKHELISQNPAVPLPAHLQSAPQPWNDEHRGPPPGGRPRPVVQSVTPDMLELGSGDQFTLPRLAPLASAGAGISGPPPMGKALPRAYGQSQPQILQQESSQDTFVRPAPRQTYDGKNTAAAAAAAFGAGYRGMEQGEGVRRNLSFDGKHPRLAQLQPPGRNRRSLEKEAMGAMAAFESVVGHMYDPVAEMLKGGGEGMLPLLTAPAHSISRKSLLLKMPVVTEGFNVDVPAVVEDRGGHTCLIILPSDKPSTRAEALAVEGLLAELLRDPHKSAARAAAWRAHVLQTMCSDAVAAINEGLFGKSGSRPLGQAWMFKAGSGRPDTLTPQIFRGTQLGSGNVLDLLGAGSGNGESAPVSSDNLAGGRHTMPPPQRLSSDVSALLADEEGPAVGARGKGHGTRQRKGYATIQDHTAELTPQASDVRGPQHAAVMSALNMAIGTTICMADIIRQVEVHCGERGRVLAYVWNAYLSTHEDSMLSLRKDNDVLTDENVRLKSEVETLEVQVEGTEYLRKEIVRFRKEADKSTDEAAEMLKENLYYKQLMEESKAEVQALDAGITKQLARLRWQHAFHVLSTRDQKVHMVSGGLGARGASSLVRKVQMVERLKTAVLRAERRKLMYGIRRRAEDYQRGATFNEVVKSALSQPAQTKWDAGMLSQASPQEVLRMLPGLQPEAQILVLFNLPEDLRAKVLQEMPAAWRAHLLVSMSAEMRKETRGAVGEHTWKDTMAVIRDNKELAARMLCVVETWEAVLEFSNWSSLKQMEVLQAMDEAGQWHTAAQLMRRLPVNMRKDLLNRGDAEMSARILQVLQPAEYINDCLEGVVELQQANILRAVTPPTAAASLMLQSVDTAAEILMLIEEEEARNKILEFMAPKTAAAVLVLMDELASEMKTKKFLLERRLAEEQGPEALAAFEARHAGSAEGGDGAGGQSVQGAADGSAAAAGSTDAAVGVGEDGLAAAAGAAAGGDEQEGDLKTKLSSDTLLGMDQNVAGNILGYMGFKDKASMLASMDPAKVAEMMALIPPEDAVALLAAMCNASMAVVSEALTPEDRAKLMRVLEAADGGNSTKKGKKGAKKGGKKGVSLNEPRKEGLEEAYDLAIDKIVAGDVDMDGDGDLPSARMSLAGTGPRGSFSGALQARASSSGIGPRTSGSGVAEAAVRARGSMSGVASNRSSSEAGVVDTVEGGRASSDGSAVRAAKPSKKAGASRLAQVASAVADVEVDADEDGDGEEDDGVGAAPIASTPTGKGKKGTGKKAGGKEKVARVSRVNEADDDDEEDGGEEGEEGEELDEALLAELNKGPSKAPASRGAGAARGRGARGGRGSGRTTGSSAADKVAISFDGGDKKVPKMMKNALKNTAEGQAAIKAARARLEAAQAAQDAWDQALEESAEGGGAAEPQGKLGKLPKNQRLKDAMAQHKNAKPKPKGWLMAVVESVYKDGEALFKKLGRAETLRKQSVPEIVFAYFFNKYGQKNVVNEYVGALVNTLTLYKPGDLRLDAFARFLSEEWDFSTFLGFLSASSMLLAPARVVCIEYPRDPAKDELYSWSDFHKCVWVADSVLGPRAQLVRDKFNELLLAACVPADDAEAERTRRDKRNEGEVIPDRFFKVHRIRFQCMLCKEVQRINTFITKLAEDKFARIDIQRSGFAPVNALPAYLQQMLPQGSQPYVLDEVCRSFTMFATAIEQDVPATDVVVEDCKAVAREPFLQASVEEVAIRDHIKMSLLPPPRPDDDVDEAEVFKTYLLSVVQRHVHTLMPHFRKWLHDADQDVLLQDQVLAVGRERVGDAKFKAYLNLLASIINIQVSGVISEVLEGMDTENLDADAVEQSVSRVEDVVIMLLHKDKYLLSSERAVQRDRIRRLPPNMRLRDLGATCKAHREFQSTVHYASAYVLQSVWLFRQARLGLATKRQDKQLVGVTSDAVDALAADLLAVTPQRSQAGAQKGALHHTGTTAHQAPGTHVQLPEGSAGGGRASGSHSGGHTPSGALRDAPTAGASHGV